MENPGTQVREVPIQIVRDMKAGFSNNRLCVDRLIGPGPVLVERHVGEGVAGQQVRTCPGERLNPPRKNVRS